MILISVHVEVQVHGDVSQERDERHRVVRGVVEDGDHETTLTSTSGGVGTQKRRQKMHSHVKQKKIADSCKAKKMCSSFKPNKMHLHVNRPFFDKSLDKAKSGFGWNFLAWNEDPRKCALSRTLLTNEETSSHFCGS